MISSGIEPISATTEPVELLDAQGRYQCVTIMHFTNGNRLAFSIDGGKTWAMFPPDRESIEYRAPDGVIGKVMVKAVDEGRTIERIHAFTSD